MGIIIKQSIRGSFWSYIGLIAGYINVGIIMPNILLKEEIGLIQILGASTLIFAQTSTLGFNGVISRIFPRFRNKKLNHNGFLFLLFFVAVLGLIVVLNTFFILKPYIIEANVDKSPLLVEYVNLFIPLIIFRVFFLLLDNYNRMLYDSVTGTFWMEFGHRFMNLLLIILVALNFINYNQFVLGYVFSFCFPVIPLVWILIKKNEFYLKPKFSFLEKPLVKEMSILAGFSFVNGFEGVFISNVDKILVSHYLTLEDVGVFGVCSLFATLILIPLKSIGKISTSIISDAWRNSNIKQIREIFTQSSINQSIIGSFLFIVIVINIDNIFNFLPFEYIEGKYVVIIYSLGILLNSSIGIGAQIISTSRYYKFGSIILLNSILSLFLFSIWFIPMFGITGAALASALTYVLRALLRVLFLKLKLNLMCFNLNHLKLLFITSVILLLNSFFTKFDSFVLDAIIRSILVTIIFGFAVMKLNLSTEMNTLIMSQLKILYNKLLPFIRIKK